MFCLLKTISYGFVRYKCDPTDHETRKNTDSGPVPELLHGHISAFVRLPAADLEQYIACPLLEGDSLARKEDTAAGCVPL